MDNSSDYITIYVFKIHFLFTFVKNETRDISKFPSVTFPGLRILKISSVMHEIYLVHCHIWTVDKLITKLGMERTTQSSKDSSFCCASAINNLMVVTNVTSADT